MAKKLEGAGLRGQVAGRDFFMHSWAGRRFSISRS